MKITLVPTAGLCNRMNAILCAIVSYEQYKIPTEIYWEKTNDCYAEFSDLFEPLNNTELTVKPLKKFYLKPGGKRLFYIPNVLRKFLFDKSYIADKPSITESKLDDLCKNKEKIYFTSYNRFCIIPTIEEPISTFFKPAKDIEEHINYITQKYYTPNTIGVHIRRTDNIAAIRESPIERFIKHMDKEIQNNSETNFYLATDSEETKKIFLNRYKDKIIPTNKTLNRNSVQGMKDAVTELYCLGKTNKIIGSKNSTFSGMAAHLFNIKIIY